MIAMQRVMLVISLMLSICVRAQVPQSIDYQGFLTDAGGTPLDGVSNLTFAIYPVASGGAPLWMESQAIAVERGLFSTTLGDAFNPFAPDLFSTPVYLGITVEGDPEMTPRRSIVAVAYAIKADDASTLQGNIPEAFDQSAHVADNANPHGVTATQTGALTASDLSAHASVASAHHVRYDNSEALAAVLAADGPGSNLDADTVDGVEGARIIALETQVAALQASVDALLARVATIEANSVLALDGIVTAHDAQTMRVTGVNLQIVNGTGTTYNVANGVGNMIVGYNTGSLLDDPICSIGGFNVQSSCEVSGGVWGPNQKTGSHNLVVGNNHNYTNNGGLLAGMANTVNGPASSALGGTSNIAYNQSTVAGGQSNISGGVFSTVVGGETNEAVGTWSVVGAGRNNKASGEYSAISGGSNNSTIAERSVVAGGSFNSARGDYSAVSGGLGNTASGNGSAVAGGDSNEAIGQTSVVSGGMLNTANGASSAVSGGFNRTAKSFYDWVAGALFQTE